MAVQYCNYDIKGTLAVTGTSTFTGAATFSSSINMSDNQPINFGGQTMFTHTGSITRIGDNSSSSVLNISGGNATFTGNVNAGTGLRMYTDGSGNGVVYNLGQDKDLYFVGDDGGTGINALVLDMSDGGYATFNSGITATNASFSGTVNIASPIYHIGDTNTYFGFNTADSIQLVTGGGQRLLANNNGVKIGSGATVTTILDEDNMASNSATALATQQSIKAYVDTSVSGVSSGVTSVATGNGISGGTITSTGTLTVGAGDGLSQSSTGLLMSGSYSNSFTVGTTSSTNRFIRVLASDSNTAGLEAYGSSQGTGYAYVGQSSTYGGGMFYNGDGSPTFATGEGSDTIGFYRKTAGANTAVFSFPHNSNTVTFNGDITVSGGDIILGGTGRIQGIDTVSASTDAANKAYVDAHVSPAGTYLPLTGGTMSGAINMGDNDIDGIDELKFSSGTKLGDNGGTSYLMLTYADSGDGGILVVDNDGQHQGYLYGDGGATSSFGLLDGTGSWAVRCRENEYVELRYDNTARLQTISDGVYVAGKLGIGTSDPNAYGYSYAEDLVIYGGASASDGAGITIRGNGKRYGIIAFGDTADANAGEIFYDHDVNAMYFRTNGSNSVVFINSAGKVTAGAATGSSDGSSTLTTKGYVDAQIATIPSGLNFQGNWNASTNSPTLASGTGTPGFYYNVSVAGSTNLDGETDWQVGDWAVFVEAGATDKWEKIDNTSALTGVGANTQVSLWGGTNTLEGSTALTFTGGDLYVTGDGNSSNWYSAYQDTITAFSDSGSSTITLTLTQRDGGTITTSFSNPQGTVTGVGATNRIAYWANSTMLQSNANFTFDGTDFTAPGAITGASLDINGAADISGSINISSANRIIEFAGTGYIGAADNFYVGGATTGTDHTYIGDNARNVTIYNGATLTVSGALNLSTLANATTDTDKFLVGDGGEVKYRTGAQVLSDIGGAPATGGAYLPLTGGTMTTTAKIYFYNTSQYIHANSNNDLTIASGDDINYISNYHRYYNGGTEFARLSATTNSWIANGTNSKLGVNKSTGINYNLDVEGTFGTTGAITIGGNATFNGATVVFNPDADSSLLIGNAGTDAIAIFAGTGDTLYLGGNNTTGLYLDTAASAVFLGALHIPEYIYHSGDTNTYIRFTADTQTFTTGGTDRLTLTNTAATFAEDVNVGTFSDSGTSAINIRAGGEHDTKLGLFESNLNHGFSLNYDGGDNKFYLKRHDNSSGGSAVLTFQRYDNNAAFAGDVTVSGGDITLGGTGRIQGIDTVSAGTDAANKDYVDTAVAGSGSGTVTGVSSSTTSQLTVSESSPAPALSIVTAAVANGGTALATGNQIYDATTTRLASYLPLSGGTMTGDLKLNDSIKLLIGTGNDLQMSHDATDSYINNLTGDLYIRQLSDNKDIIFQSDDGSGGTAEYLKIDGQYEQVYLQKDMQVADGKKIMFGDSVQQSGDLQIYHDGSNSYIDETGTGSLYIKSAGAIRLQSDTGENMIYAVNNGAVNLYYNNSNKLQTTNDGVTIAGAIDLNSSAMIDWANGDARIIEGEVGGYSLSFEIYNGVAATERVLLLEKDKTATFSGDIALSADSSIVLDDTPTASTASGSGTIVNWSVSESTTAGTLYVVKTNGGWTTADADSEAKSTAMAAIALGSNATAGMLLQGFFYKASHGFAIGSPLYISNTAGAFSNTRPTGTGDYVRIIGYATSANYIYFDPDKTWVKID